MPMNDDVISEAGNVLQRFTERYPHFGMFASFSSFAASLLSFINVITPIIGFVAACFGLIAGYYSMRCLHRKWVKKQNDE